MLVCLGLCLPGCRSTKNAFEPASETFEHAGVAMVDGPFEPQPSPCTPDVLRISHEQAMERPPRPSADELPVSRPATLEEVLRTGLSQTAILRSLGAQVLSNPNAGDTSLEPLLQYSDPVFGEQAALAAFDATISASLNHANNDDVFNNTILGGGATEVVQDLSTADLSWQKIAMSGRSYTLRSRTVYDNNDNPTSIFPSSYSGFWEAQVRQPLLQGAGTTFNQIAGPNSRPGFRNTSGLLVAQINTDVSVASFELGMRRYVDQVIAAYWNLNFAYENLESAKLVRDTSMDIWSSVKAKFENDLAGGEADKEAQAREQYYVFEQQYIAAVNGDPQQGITGVIQAEAELRRLIGLPVNDGAMLKPVEQPTNATTVFDWSSLVNMALERRVEIRRQMWQVKRRELELIASKNFMLPRLDATATFRNNGFGDDLTGGAGRFSSVLKDQASGDHNEWEMGLQLNVPVGYRQAKSGVQNAEYRLRRERLVLDEQEKQVIADLDKALRQSSQSARNIEIARKRLDAAQDTVLARLSAYAADAIPLDQLLDAQRRLAEAQTNFHRSQVNQELALQGIYRESGQLLSMHSIWMDRSVRE
jgi:outer membrane protein TolC